MALLWFGGLDRYKTGNNNYNSYLPTNDNILPSKATNTPLPNMNGIYLRVNGQNTNFNICELGNFLETDVKRKWLEGRCTSSTGSTSRSNRYFEISLLSQDIPAQYKTPGTTICFGFRFRANNIAAAHQRKYISFGSWDTLVATPTNNTAISAGTAVYPIDVAQAHPLALATQEKYIEYRIKYREDHVYIKIFVNKDLMHEVTLPLEKYWGIFAGAPRSSSVLNNSSLVTSVFFNDFYMGVDQPGDENPTDLIGPVTVKQLEMLPVTYEGEWKTSDPAISINETLQEPLTDKRRNMTGNYVISDIGDRPAHIRFRAPTEEKLKIVAFQHDFIAQQPLAYSTSLQYARYAGDKILEANNKPVTMNIALEPNFSHVGLKAITHMPDGGDITTEFIGSISLKINSVKKYVPDDDDSEFNPDAAEEEAE